MMKRIWCVVLLVLLVGCRSRVVAMEEVASGDLVYQEDFNDPSSGWERTAKEIGSLDYYNGVYRIIVNAPTYNLWTTVDLIFSDVRMEVDAARFGGPEENRFGLICRYQDARDFYFFIISSDGYYGIGSVHDGTLNLLSDPMMKYSDKIITGVAPNHLMLDCVGDTLTGYVNGKRLAEVKDGSFINGRIGVLVGTFGETGVDIVFDDLLVSKP